MGPTHQAQASFSHTPARCIPKIRAGNYVGVVSRGVGCRREHQDERGRAPGLLTDRSQGSAAMLGSGRLPRTLSASLGRGPEEEFRRTRTPGLDFPRRRNLPSPIASNCAFFVPRRRLPSLPVALLSNCVVW